MSKYKVIRIVDNPELLDDAANWFHAKWGVPLEAYLESMHECLKAQSAVPQWYAVMDNDRIIAGLGVIENERYNWKFFCMVQGDGEPHKARMYIHQI